MLCPPVASVTLVRNHANRVIWRGNQLVAVHCWRQGLKLREACLSSSQCMDNSEHKCYNEFRAFLQSAGAFAGPHTFTLWVKGMWVWEPSPVGLVVGHRKDWKREDIGPQWLRVWAEPWRDLPFGRITMATLYEHESRGGETRSEAVAVTQVRTGWERLGSAYIKKVKPLIRLFS